MQVLRLYLGIRDLGRALVLGAAHDAGRAALRVEGGTAAPGDGASAAGCGGFRRNDEPNDRE